MAFDSKVQRKVFGKWATGVTVVTTDGPAGKGGLTANAVASLSLDPPLVLVAVAKSAGSYSEIKQNGCYAINILAQAHEDVSKRFATPGPKDFSGFPWKTDVTGAPILEGALGYVDCKVREILPGGDHDIFVGEIVGGEAGGEDPPLMYFSGKYRRMAE
ncbi:MAG: flavin reductase family protein [Planctomycetia bacterium]|nr:flavin reductase family protein [Planctomycetia bacterium]